MKNVILRFSLITFFVSFILLFVSSCSNSNDYEIFCAIHGVVTDYSDGQPLANATVVLSPTGLSKQTDASGFFEFENLEPQQYTITVQRQGYQPNRRTVTAISGENLQIDVQLLVIPQ